MKRIILILFVIFLVGCAGKSNDVSNAGSGEISGAIQEQDGDDASGIIGQDTIKEFTITAKRFEFNSNEITVNNGDRVRLKITSMDVTHGFSLPSFNINKNLKPGEEVIIEFTADKTGTFTFACSVVCGSGHGSMNGRLIVK